MCPVHIPHELMVFMMNGTVQWCTDSAFPIIHTQRKVTVECSVPLECDAQ